MKSSTPPTSPWLGLPPLSAPLEDPDLYWLVHARHYAAQSIDPVLRSGAVVVRSGRCLFGSSDGMPTGVRSTAARRRAEHTRKGMLLSAEHALVASAAAHGVSLQGGTCYLWPFISSAVAIALLIHAGCLAVVTPELPAPARFEAELLLVRDMAAEAGILLRTADIAPLLTTAADPHG